MAQGKAVKVEGIPAAPPKRRNRKRDVIDAATDVFFRKGYSAASVQDVADAVGVLKGSLYYYIASKEDLLFWILEDVHESSALIREEVMALDAEPLDRLRIYIERHVAWYLENLEEVTVFFRDWRYLAGERLETVAERRRGYDRVLRELVVAAQDNGDADPRIDAKYASFFLLAAVNHVPDWYRRDAGDAPEEIAGAIADLAVGTLVGTRPREAAPVPVRRAVRRRSRASS